MENGRYSIEDLPRFSPWPARLLGQEPVTRRHKSREEVEREYEREKWAPLLARMQEEGDLSLDRADELFCGPEDVLYYEKPDFKVGPVRTAHRLHNEYVWDAIEPWLPAPAVVDLGCGYGSVLLHVARKLRADATRVLGAEFTESGARLARLLAEAEGLAVEVGRCDLTKEAFTDLEPPPGSVYFTSAVISSCIPTLPEHFVEALVAKAPKAVVHFELCYEHCEPGSVFGLMRKKYIEVNDYNRNLLTLLRAKEREGLIRIVREEPAVFGYNPLYSESLIVWEPAAGR